MSKTILRLLLVCFLIGMNSLFAQSTSDIAYKTYNWESNPKLHTLSAQEMEGNYIFLKDKIIIEYAYEASGQLVEYSTRHCIIHFNTEKGIEEMNKVYISYSNILEEMDLKARTITSEGKIIPLSKSAVKKIDNLQNSGPYMFFAMEGVDKGAEIEYLYTNKKSANTNLSWTLQDDFIRKDVQIDIYSPDNLVFEARGYNGFPKFEKDTSLKTKNHIYTAIANLPILNEEKYSAYESNKMRFDYQLTYNSVKGKSRLNSWESCGLTIYNAIFSLEKAEIKAVDKLISKLKLADKKSDEEKIQALEQFIKTTISVQDEHMSVDKLLDVKYGNDFSLQRLYVGVANALKIPVEVVATTNRLNRKFDSDFATWNSLDQYLLYFSGMDKYLSCSNYSSRLGFPPPELTNNKGLFVKETGIGDIKTGIAKIKTIDYTAYTSSHNDLYEEVELNPETFTPTIKVKQEFAGYSAFYLQPGFLYMDENQKKEVIEDLAKFMGKETVVKSSKISGTAKEDILIQPLVVESVIEVPHLIENAGNNYIFKVGALIGPQDELYQEKERQSDGEISYTHSFTRRIEVKIPTGYKIKNLEDLKIDKKDVLDGKVLCSFVSNYTQEGEKLIIAIYEDYQVINYPKSNFEPFKKVINASADFNKVAIVIGKL